MNRTAFALFGLVVACRSAGEAAGPTAAAAASDDFDARVEAFFRASLEMMPTLGVNLGLHQYDGRLPDVSKAAMDRYVAYLKAELVAFEAMTPSTPQREYERQIVLAQIRESLFQLEDLDIRRRNPMLYPSVVNLSDYVSREYAPAAKRAEGIASICTGLSDFFATATENLAPPFPKTWVQTALLQTRGLRSFVTDDVPVAFGELEDAGRSRLETAVAQCDAALEEYETYLEGHEASATDDFALGADLFLKMLRETESLDISLDRLREIGEADLARNLATLEAVAAEAKTPVTELVTATLEDRPPADQVLAVATRQAVEMRQLIDDAQIVSVPLSDEALVRESPAFMRWNSAFLSSAGPFEEKALPSFYYISPPDPSWPEEMQKSYIPNRHDLLFITIHELWPGHFLHGLHGKAGSSKVGKAFCSYAMSEGWAHYAEEMMLEAGAGAGDPKVHVGQLQNALLRNVRYMSAIGLHTGGMTVEESKALFIEKGLQDEGNAMQQATRGTFDPGYLKYTLGKLMIMKLHDDWKAQEGDRYSLKRFHDTFLSYQCAPVPAIRALMLGNDSPPL